MIYFYDIMTELTRDRIDILKLQDEVKDLTRQVKIAKQMKYPSFWAKVQKMGKDQKGNQRYFIYIIGASKLWEIDETKEIEFSILNIQGKTNKHVSPEPIPAQNPDLQIPESDGVISVESADIIPEIPGVIEPIQTEYDEDGSQ